MGEIFCYTDAREFFGMVSQAAQEIETARETLGRYERAALAVPGGIHERISGGAVDDRIAWRVAAKIDAEGRLRDRLADDCHMLSLARIVLYGKHGNDGLASLAPAWWAEVLRLRYCERKTWPQVGAAVSYSSHRCQQVRSAAFDVIDAHGLLRVAQGLGFAEG